MLTRLLFATLVLAIASGAAWGQSQPRSPQTKPVQTQRSPPAQTAAPDQRGTDQMPFSVKVFPAPKPKDEATQDEQWRKEKADVDKRLADETQRLADYTGALAVVTVCLFVAAIFQVGLFWFQLRLMREGVRDTRTAADAARDAAQVARDDLIATHRPILSVRHVAIAEPQEDTELEIKFIVANVGSSPAEIIEVNGTMRLGPGSELPPLPPYNPGYTLRPGHKIGAGESLPLQSRSDLYSRGTFDMFMRDQSARFYFFGYILFADGRGVKTRMGFGRKYDRTAKHFRPMNNPDYEY